MKQKRIFWLLLILLNIIFTKIISADTTYLPLEYHTVRYSQENGKGTTIWYAVIPAKYKMHYAYGQDLVRAGEAPSSNAQRHNATIAVNTQFLGFPTINGNTLNILDNVAGYEFYITKKTNPVADWDIFNVYGVDKYSESWGVNLKDIDVGFDYFGDKIPYNSEYYMYMAVFNQLVMNGVSTTSNNEYIVARHPRTWLAYDYDGTQYVAVAAGRDAPFLNGESIGQLGLTGAEIIAATKQFMTTNIKTLYNLDGGGSAGFIYKGNKISPNYDDNYTTERSAIAGIFYWKAENYKIKYDCDIGMRPEHGLADYVVTENGSFRLASNLCTYDGYHQDGWMDSSGKLWPSGLTGTWNYDNTEAGISNYTLELTAKYVVNDYLSFNNSLSVIEGKRILKGIHAATTASSFKNMISTNGTVSLTNGSSPLNENHFVSTGDVLTITFSENTNTYILSVTGDYNRDGVVTRSDLNGISERIINKSGFIEDQFYAADYNNDNLIKMNDVMAIIGMLQQQ